MIHLHKSPLPPNIAIKSERDYQSGIVLDILVEDCHNKCYICEDKPTTINVEHIVAHRGDPKLKFELQRTIDELEATYKSILRENLG